VHTNKGGGWSILFGIPPLDLDCYNVHMEKLEKHFEIFFPVFIEENCKVNLVSFSNKKEFFYKHFYDSAQLLDFMDIQPFEKVLDVGTGGGFPGLVLAMLRPHASFVLVDSVRKKINCIKRILTSIGIDNVELVCERAELLGHNHTFRGQFSIVVSRAVASLNALSE